MCWRFKSWKYRLLSGFSTCIRIF